MTTKKNKIELPDPVIPLEIPVGVEDPLDLGEGVKAGTYFNEATGSWRFGIVKLGNGIKWASVGLAWD